MVPHPLIFLKSPESARHHSEGRSSRCARAPDRGVNRRAVPRHSEVPAPTEEYVSNEQDPLRSFLLKLRPIGMSDPARWLAAGWADFRAFPGIGLFYGACFALMGAVLVWAFINQPAYLLALAGGFLLVGPFLCLGLYDVSRKRERGQTPTLAASLTAWRGNVGATAIFCAVLLVLEMLWSRSALVIFAVAFNRIPGVDSTVAMLIHPSNIGFIMTYFVVGALFSTLIFATTVVSMPMLLDRTTDSITAAITSFRACLTFPKVMALWAGIIALSISLSMLPALLGLLVAAPVIGHASWHAYRGIVERPDGP